MSVSQLAQGSTCIRQHVRFQLARPSFRSARACIAPAGRPIAAAAKGFGAARASTAKKQVPDYKQKKGTCPCGSGRKFGVCRPVIHWLPHVVHRRSPRYLQMLQNRWKLLVHGFRTEWYHEVNH